MTTRLITYFDRNYLPQGIALLRSIIRHVPDWSLHVLALDAWTETVLREMTNMLPNLHVTPLAALEADEENGPLAQRKLERSWSEYIFTLTPIWMQYVLDLWGGPLAYIDADCFFLTNPSPLYEEITAASVAIIPHRWTPQHAERLRPNGKYNVGWVYMGDNKEAYGALYDWRRACLDWQPSDKQRRFSDQIFLDDWPDYYSAHVVKNVGANLAPWSAEQYEYELIGVPASALVRDEPTDPVLPIVERLAIKSPDASYISVGVMTERYEPVIFYHFHEWRRNRAGVIQRTGYPIPAAVAEHIYKPYEAEVADVYARLYP